MTASLHNGRHPLLDPLLGWMPAGRGWVPSLRYLLRRERVLAAVPQSGEGDLLEVGCGAATLLVELCDRGYRCTGLESSAPALEQARSSISESGRDVRLVSEPESTWSNQFGMLLALDVLEHIEDDAAALRQWASWLLPGGSLLLSVPAHQRRWGSGDVWAGHFRRYDRDELLSKVRLAGLDVTRTECYGFPLANLTEMLGEPVYRRALRARAEKGSADQECGNALSGIDRSVYRKSMPLVASLPGREAIRLAQWCQRLALGTDWGSGYFLVAQRP
jgi:SAM-dependent methyltransferase